MAATAIYVSISRIPLASIPDDGVLISNVAATQMFTLRGGRYGVTVKASTYGTLTLQVLAADASTYITILPAFAADGVAIVDLPPGNYRLLVA